MVILHKLILTNKYLRYTPFWWWWRLISHEGFRFDDYYVWGEFWHSISSGWEQMEYVNEFEKYWGKTVEIDDQFIADVLETSSQYPAWVRKKRMGHGPTEGVLPEEKDEGTDI